MFDFVQIIFLGVIHGIRNRFVKILDDLEDSVQVSVGVPCNVPPNVPEDVPFEFCGICWNLQDTILP